MMNFQQSDALGGLYEGRKARQAYDTAELQQQQTLEQIATAQQNREFNAAAEPGKRESEGRLRDLHPGAMQIQEHTIDEAKAKQATRFVDDWMKMPDGPNTEAFLIDRYKVPANHPIIAATREAKLQGPEAVEALKQKFAISDQKSRDDTDRAVKVEAQRGKDAAAALERATKVQELRNSGALAVKVQEGNDRIKAAIEKAKTSGAAKDKNIEKQLVAFVNEARAINEDTTLTPEAKAAKLAVVEANLNVVHTLWQNSPAGRRASAEIDIAAATGDKVRTVVPPAAPRLPGAGGAAPQGGGAERRFGPNGQYKAGDKVYKTENGVKVPYTISATGVPVKD